VITINNATKKEFNVGAALYKNATTIPRLARPTRKSIVDDG
jgi:hypothetical protein